MKEALGRVEKDDENEITDSAFTWGHTAGRAPYDVLNFLFGGFLCTHLEDEACIALEMIEGQRGFEMRRNIVKDIIRKRLPEWYLVGQSVIRREACRSD